MRLLILLSLMIPSLARAADERFSLSISYTYQSTRALASLGGGEGSSKLYTYDDCVRAAEDRVSEIPTKRKGKLLNSIRATCRDRESGQEYSVFDFDPNV